MPNVMSNVPEIDNIHFVEWNKVFTSKPTEVKIVRVGNLLLASTKSGLACNSLKNFAYTMGNWPFNKPLLKALVRLGKITPQMMESHLDACERCSQRHTARGDLDDYNRIIKRHGSIKQLKAKVNGKKPRKA